MSLSRLVNEASRTVNRLLRPVGPCIVAWMLSPSLALTQDVHARSVLTAHEIVKTMQNNQLPTRGVEVRLAVPATSNVAYPALEIQEMTPLNQHDVRLRIACQDRSHCLPFFAIATYQEAIDPVEFQTKIDRQATRISKTPPAAGPKAETSAPATLAKPLNPGGPPVLRSGSHASLDFDGDRIHVRVEVICLQGGATGDKIRVTTRDRKQVYIAEIVAPNVLKGTLPR